MQLSPQAFHRHPVPPQQVVFELPRPSRGYTQTFPSFWSGHPEFQLNREQVRDPDVLRTIFHSENVGAFNRARYTVPEVDKMLEEAAGLTDANKRADIYKQIQQRVLKDTAVVPLVDTDVIESMPAIVENCFSSGVATAEAIVSGLAPGSIA